jgi:hypothetical protein
MPAKEKMPASQFKSIISALCERWHIPEYGDYLCERYWPAFSQLDEAGQRAFWQVLGVQEEQGTEDTHAVCDH